MSRDSTTAYYVAQAIDNLWSQGKNSPTVRDITGECFKDVPPSAPLMQIVRNQIGGALRVLSELGRLGHPVTPYYFKLPVRNGTRLIPLDTVARRKCVPLSAGPRGTFGVRMVESRDDPLLLEALGQAKVMTAGTVKEFEKRQRQAKEGGLLSRVLVDVRDPSWFEQALLNADPQLGLPLTGEVTDVTPEPGPA